MTLHTEIDQSFTIYRNSNDKSMGSITFPIGQLDALQSSLMRLQMELKDTEAEKQILITIEKDHEEILLTVKEKLWPPIITEADLMAPFEGKTWPELSDEEVAEVKAAIDKANAGENIIVVDPAHPIDGEPTVVETTEVISSTGEDLVSDPAHITTTDIIDDMGDSVDILDMTKLQLLRFLASFEIFSYSMDDSKAELLDAAAAASRDKKEE